MTIFAVGQLYNPNRTSWPEAVQYNYMAGEHHLHLFMRQPTQTEVQAVKTGPAEFALVTEGILIVLLYHFAPIPWSDAPYSWHMTPADQRALPADVPDGSGALLTIILTDAATGIVKAIRAVGLSTDFTNKLHAAIRAQAARPFDQTAYDDQLNRVYARYPKTELLLSKAIARYTAGTPEPPSGRTPRGRRHS
jgi:hypothetical protein